MRPYTIKPLKRPIQAYFNPAWRACNRLTPVVIAPSFNETNSNRTHLGELKHGIVALGHGACQYVGEFTVRENFQIATRQKFAYSGRMPAVYGVTIGTLHEYGTVAQAFGIHIAAHVVETHAASD